MSKIGLKQVSAILGLSLLVWLACSTVSKASERSPLTEAAAKETDIDKSGGLSTDLLEADPVMEPTETPIPIEPIPIEGILAEDIPEEILRTEIITGARSPLTGEPLTAAEYAQLQETLDNPVEPNRVSDDIRYLVFLLQVRRAVRPILPFVR